MRKGSELRRRRREEGNSRLRSRRSEVDLDDEKPFLRVSSALDEEAGRKRRGKSREEKRVR